MRIAADRSGRSNPRHFAEEAGHEASRVKGVQHVLEDVEVDTLPIRAVEDPGRFREVSRHDGQTGGAAEDQILVPGNQIPSAIDARAVDGTVLASGCPPGVP